MTSTLVPLELTADERKGKGEEMERKHTAVCEFDDADSCCTERDSMTKRVRDSELHLEQSKLM
jgi:hypothetical protein